MNERIDWTTIVLFLCVGLGMIGSYWFWYYVDEKSEIEKTFTPVPEKIVPTVEWDAEDGKDKG